MRRVTKSRCVNGLICATCDCCMLSQELSTFLRQHTTVACRTNKPVYTARFCRISHVFVASCKRAFRLDFKPSLDSPPDTTGNQAYINRCFFSLFRMVNGLLKKSSQFQTKRLKDGSYLKCQVFCLLFLSDFKFIWRKYSPHTCCSIFLTLQLFFFFTKRFIPLL